MDNNLPGLGKLEVWVLRLPLGDSSLERFDIQDIILLHLSNLCNRDVVDDVVVVFWVVNYLKPFAGFSMTQNPRSLGR